MGAVCAGLLAPVRGQQATRPSLARQKPQPTLPKDFNVKTGPVLFRVSAALRAEFIDNVNLSDGTVTPIEPDLILNPQIGIDAAWPITQLNTLRFRTTLGYTKNLNHPELDSSSVLLSPDSEVTFDVFTGDLKISFHDRFSYTEDPIGEGALSNTAKFGRFTNVAGVSVLWDLNDLILSAGYDHTNLITTVTTSGSGATDSGSSGLDQSSDQVFGSAFLSLGDATGIGIEGTASLTRFPENPAQDATSASLGPFYTAQLTRYTKVYLAAGYRAYFPTDDADSVSAAPATGFFAVRASPAEDANSYYATLIVSHRLNRHYNERLAIGHESQIGLFGQRTETAYVNYSSVWQLAPAISLTSTLFFDSIEEGGAGALIQPYRRLGLSFNTGYLLTQKLSASFGYQYTERISDGGLGNYRQNRLSIGLSYQF